MNNHRYQRRPCLPVSYTVYTSNYQKKNSAVPDQESAINPKNLQKVKSPRNKLLSPTVQRKSPSNISFSSSLKNSQQKIKNNETNKTSWNINSQMLTDFSSYYLDKIKKNKSERYQKDKNIRFTFDEQGLIKTGLNEPNGKNTQGSNNKHKGTVRAEIDSLKQKIKFQKFFQEKKRKSYQSISVNRSPSNQSKSPTKNDSMMEATSPKSKETLKKSPNTKETLSFSFELNQKKSQKYVSKDCSHPISRNSPQTFFLTPKPQTKFEPEKIKRIYSPVFEPGTINSPSLPQMKFQNSKISIKDFILDRKLGNGKYGIVYKSIHIKTGSVYAIKKISKLTIKENMMIDQFVLETKIQMCLKNQNIVQLYSIIDDQAYIYLIQEYLPDGSLLAKLKKAKSLPEEQVANIIKQITNALNHMREIGIVHRDIKPENIVLLGQTCKLCDFGWATFCKTDQRRNTFCGTFDYTAPEMFEGEKYDQSVDLWCLGILTYELLVGKPPFYHISKKQTIQNIKNANLKKLRYPGNITEAAKQFIQCLLQKNPKQRKEFKSVVCHKFLDQELVK